MRRAATAGLATNAAVICLALLSAISPGAGDAGFRESPPPPPPSIVVDEPDEPDPRGESLGSSQRLQY